MLTAGLVGLIFAMGFVSPAAKAPACSPDLAAIGACTSVSNGGTQVDLGASATTPGTRPSSGGGRPQTDAAPAPPTTAPAEPDCGDLCRNGTYEVVVIPDVTIADLASFRPAAPGLSGEPLGVAIAGLPANLLATASAQDIPGTLLGWDVTVRFVPAAFVFSHGDGSTARSDSGGASWASLGQAQFTPTPTSHVYRARGVYEASVTVQYAASVDFGTGWRPVPGFVTAGAGGYDIRVLEATTALVDRTCTEDPRGPGC
jgi:hypothetical protein